MTMWCREKPSGSSVMWHQYVVFLPGIRTSGARISMVCKSEGKAGTEMLGFSSWTLCSPICRPDVLMASSDPKGSSKTPYTRWTVPSCNRDTQTPPQHWAPITRHGEVPAS